MPKVYAAIPRQQNLNMTANVVGLNTHSIPGIFSERKNRHQKASLAIFL